MHGRRSCAPCIWRQRRPVFYPMREMFSHLHGQPQNTVATSARAIPMMHNLRWPKISTSTNHLRAEFDSYRRSRFGQAEDKPYSGTLLDFALDPNPASVRFDDFFRQG